VNSPVDKQSLQTCRSITGIELRSVADRLARHNVALTPATVWNTARSCARCSTRQYVPIPVVATRCHLTFGTASKFEISKGGQLLLGFSFWPTEGKLYLRLAEGARIKISGKVKIAAGSEVLIGRDGLLEIGNGTYINSRTLMYVTTRVTIGEGCAIAWRASFIDDDYHSIGSGSGRAEPITLGDRVWIGAEAMVLKGVSIGNGSVVAARSVVAHDVPDRVLVAGNPARIIKEDVDWIL